MKAFLLTILSLGWVAVVQSAEISGEIKGDRLTWQSAQITARGLTPAVWDIPLQLPSAATVTPGGPNSTAERTLVLRGAGKSVSVPLTILGIAYQLTSNVNTSSVTGSATTDVSGTTAHVMGQGVGSTQVTLSAVSSPFSHYRPIIKPIDVTAWLKAFKDAGANQGAYQGVISYSIPYDYRRGGILVRYIIPTTLVIRLDYNPAQLNSVNVTGNDVMQPQYYGYPERLVRGTTHYTINATGVFPNGVMMGLRGPTPAGGYQLLSQSSTPSIGIDYDVECTSGCGGATHIITKGSPNIDAVANRLTIPSQNGTSAQAVITVSFSDKKLSELSGDSYEGTFTLLFEAGI